MEKNKEQLDKAEEIKKLTDSDLSKVVGGIEYNYGEQIEYPTSNICKYFVCKFCGNKTYFLLRGDTTEICDKCGLRSCCQNCALSSTSNGSWYCNDEHIKRK